jgi:hypothetical protein
MRYGVAWVDPVNNAIVRWSVSGFSDTPDDMAAMKTIVVELNTHESPENPGHLVSVARGVTTTRAD